MLSLTQIMTQTLKFHLISLFYCKNNYDEKYSGYTPQLSQAILVYETLNFSSIRKIYAKGKNTQREDHRRQEDA
jgi:hypothetical protein